MNHVKCGRCVRCGREYPAVPNLTNCECGGILDIIYDYDRIRTVLTRETLKNRTERSMWRYRELLPVEPETPAPPLRVGWSPLYEADRLARELGIAKLWVKDDGQNPTASLKDRASAMAVAKAQEAGAHVIACSSTGNAASSLAGNAAAAGLQTFIFVPSRAPKGKVAQLMTFGATVISVQGSYEDTFELSKQAIDRWGWYNRNAAINPYLSEGKKTVAYEIAEQLDVNKATVSRTLLRAKKVLNDKAEDLRQEDLREHPNRLDLAEPETARYVLSRLTETQAVYLYLYYGEWLDMRSIGALLGVDHSTVCRTIHRAAGRIRALCTDGSGVELLGVDALEPALYALYRQHAADDLIPERARAAARRATASGAQKRQERTPDRALITAPIWGQRRHRAAAQSRLLRALEDAAAQRTGSLLARLRALLRAFRVKITRAA